MIGLIGAAASAVLVVIVTTVVTVLRTPDDLFDVFVDAEES